MEEPRDLITGLPLPGGEDEPVRQAAEALLLDLGYSRAQIGVEVVRELPWQGGVLRVRADLLVERRGQPALLLRCARGSLVSREREAVAAARLLGPAWLPLAAVFNGQEGELLEVSGGKVLASGPRAIPALRELERLLVGREPHSPSPRETLQAARVYSTYSFISCPGQCAV